MLISINHKETNTNARTGQLNLSHGKVETPVFMPVGTNGAVKAIGHDKLTEIGFDLILGNTYHLYLRPGMEVIEKAGGLHKFTSWNKNILTDSGGYQVFSLAPFRKIKKEGVYFRSHIDGSYHTLTPEKVVDIQTTLGSDILMPLDLCTEPGIEYKDALKAVKTTTDWLKKSKIQWEKRNSGNLFGIIQGNFFKDLREMSSKEILELDLPGIAIGGLSVGESKEQFSDYLEHTAAFLPEDKPRYLMGIGTPEYILEAVENGIDMFDCVFPTRIARNGTVFTQYGMIPLKKAMYKFDQDPIDTNCNCYVCKNYSKSYLRHLFRAKEILGPMLTTHHNLYFIENLMKNIRLNIKNDNYKTFKKDFLNNYLVNK